MRQDSETNIIVLNTARDQRTYGYHMEKNRASRVTPFNVTQGHRN